MALGHPPAQMDTWRGRRGLSGTCRGCRRAMPAASDGLNSLMTNHSLRRGFYHRSACAAMDECVRGRSDRSDRSVGFRGLRAGWCSAKTRFGGARPWHPGLAAAAAGWSRSHPRRLRLVPTRLPPAGVPTRRPQDPRRAPAQRDLLGGGARLDEQPAGPAVDRHGRVQRRPAEDRHDNEDRHGHAGRGVEAGHHHPRLDARLAERKAQGHTQRRAHQPVGAQGRQQRL